MEWYFILLIVLGCLLGLFVLLFLFFLFNGDGKIIEKIYNWLIKYHDNHKREEKI